MQYRTFNKTGEKISLLGVGTMRLPQNEDGSINRSVAIDMIRTAIDEGGVNYVDTAYMYHDGESEVVVGEALKDGYREKVFLADKMPAWFARTPEDIEAIFNEQLRRTGQEYFDFYLLHNVTKAIWKIANKHNTMEFLDRMQAEGKIKHLGFSFHDDCDFFKEVIDARHWDFCQIQFNYMDKDFQAGVEGLKYAGAKGIPVIIMEPLKGGKLTDIVPDEIQAIWNCADEQRSAAEWAFRWVADFPEVMTILSGMSSMEQVQANIEILDKALPNSLSEKEHEIINKVSETYNSLIQYSCTGCRYCMPCAAKIDIPFAIDLYNQVFIYKNMPKIERDYAMNFPKGKRAVDCIDCKACEGHCPQHLPISDIMKKIACLLDK